MTEQSERAADRATRVISALVSTLWLWAIPALLAMIAVRYFFPSARDPFEPAGEPLAKLATELAPAIWAALFLLFALVARYWAKYVPGAEPRPPSAKGGAKTTRRALSFSLVVALAAAGALLFRSSVFQSYHVLSGSMLPTLAPGTVLAVDKLAFGLKLPFLDRRPGKAPERGDVVVFHSPEANGQDETELVKRVVGLPGDRVGVVGGRTVINRWVVPACIAGHYPLVGASGASVARLHVEFLEDRAYVVLYPMGQVPAPLVEYQVKPGEVFVLGDNRAASADSRSWNKGRGGGLPVSAISGRVTRTVVASDRNERLDVSRLFEPLGLGLNLHGVESATLDENVKACLKLKPKDTRPPPVSHGKVSP